MVLGIIGEVTAVRRRFSRLEHYLHNAPDICYDFSTSVDRFFCGDVVQLVRTLACHAGGREFKSRRLRQQIHALYVVHIRRVFYLLNGWIKTPSYVPDDNVSIPVNILPQMGVAPEYLGMLRAQCFSTDFCCIIYR